MRYTPRDLARMLGQKPPTTQQSQVIAAPVEPLLVVAGAGSGKTETIAARVVWLVANGHVRADQVLGLTFTRKAAGELGSRVRDRLSRLVRELGRDELLAGEPTVATYHSYAARVVREHGVRAGYEPTVRLLTEASSWQIADAVVREYDGDMSCVTAAASTVTEAVIKLSADLAEHVKTPEDLAAWTGRFFAEVQGKTDKIPKKVREVLDRQRARLQLLPLVRAYTERKRSMESFDFGDQLLFAARVALECPEVSVAERDRYRVVLLDEYQDTSHAQTVLLRALFREGHPVTAVGDPCQSIYGWRGASAGTLERFPHDFPRCDGSPGAVLSLTTSWRNRPEILDVANAISQPLRALGHRVAQLAPADIFGPGRPSLHALSGAPVRCALLETCHDEGHWLASTILDVWRQRARVGSDTPASEIPRDLRPTTAIVVRTRALVPAIAEALTAHGLPYEVVGLGGLLETPEVRDVVSVLRVLSDPTDGAALLRMMTGPRWRIGPRDLVAVYRRARDLAAIHRDVSEKDGVVMANRLDEAVLIEAIDDLGEVERYSPEGYRRLSALACELRSLNSRRDQSLPDLICDVERTIGIDIEVAVNAPTSSEDSFLARSHLDAFVLVAERFSGETDHATLRGFLAYLTAAENSERGLALGETTVVEGVVHVLTMHGAKGLEWDIVAVAGMTQGTLPSPSNSNDHWLRGLGVVPFPLRGDAAGLPIFDLGQADNDKGVVQAIDAFDVDWREHTIREERRLAYVAVTRPRYMLLASGYWWAEGVRRYRGPSPFLSEIRDRCLAGAGRVDIWVEQPRADASNPLAAGKPRMSWPIDPLGSRRDQVEAAAALVKESKLIDVIDGDPVVEQWTRDASLLLAEEALSPSPAYMPVDVVLPPRLSVSQLVTLRHDPERLARTLRRPLPSRPDERTRRGTRFHQWIERRYVAEQLFDLDELGDEEITAESDGEIFEQLRERFEASEWADRTPIEVEVPFSTTIGSTILRGRIDAVFLAESTEEGLPLYEVVDWKTGAMPSGSAARAAEIQLAAYRLAWSAIATVPVDRVSAAFFYVRYGVTVRPSDLLDKEGLVALISDLPVTSTNTSPLM